MDTVGNSVNPILQPSSQTMTSRISRPSQKNDQNDQKNDQKNDQTEMEMFSQLAKQCARETKRKVRTRTEYCMSANAKVIEAFNTLETTLQIERQNPVTASAAMTDSDFQLLKQGIANFRVRVKVDDNLTLCELRQIRVDCDLRKNTMAHALSGDEASDLNYWATALMGEIRRFGFNAMRQLPGVPSQHVQIMRSDGVALRNILSPETIRRKFISLDVLAKTIGTELASFLTADTRKSDRKAVVDQIKESCRSRRRM
jgi:hypothetical protein